MALVKHNNNSISAVTSMASLTTGAMTLIKEQTASGADEVDFNDGSGGVVLDSTYPIYKFIFTDIHPTTDGTQFAINLRNGSTAQTKTTTSFYSQQSEAGTDAQVSYNTSTDLAQSTSDVKITNGVGSDNDQSCSGELIIFNPSSTTFVKHFISRVHENQNSNYATTVFTGGYANTTSAIDSVRFKMIAGQFDGTIKLYGIKDS